MLLEEGGVGNTHCNLFGQKIEESRVPVSPDLLLISCFTAYGSHRKVQHGADNHTGLRALGVLRGASNATTKSAKNTKKSILASPMIGSADESFPLAPNAQSDGQFPIETAHASGGSR